MGMLLLQPRDLVEQPMSAARIGAVTWIYFFDGSAGVPREPVVGTNLAERVVDMREFVCRNLREWISGCRPVGVVADDSERPRCRRCALPGPANERDTCHQAERENRRGNAAT